MMSLSKKGQLGGGFIGGTVATVVGLLVISVVVFVAVLVGGNMSSSTSDNNAKAVINNMTQGAGQFAGLSGTYWIIAGVALILAILFGAVGFLLYSKR